VKGGKEVVLTERGRPIAIIKPVTEERSEEAALKAMADEGLITLPSRKGPTPAPHWKPVAVKSKPVSQTVIEDREDRA
jgi:antitoxin (DNA-binding transcriptional repressor) of toxin-antitoxin stability system